MGSSRGTELPAYPTTTVERLTFISPAAATEGACLPYRGFVLPPFPASRYFVSFCPTSSASFSA
eukprot:scaffold627082_cov18-Prasinocladus_malaysianus.AAC.1